MTTNILADSLSAATFDKLASSYVDITAPKTLEVSLSNDGATLWVNVNGVCVFRACRIKDLHVSDELILRGKHL